MVPFWPQFGPTCPIFVKIKGHPKTCHLSFSLNKEDSTLLMLKNQYGGIHVEVKASGLFTKYLVMYRVNHSKLSFLNCPEIIQKSIFI